MVNSIGNIVGQRVSGGEIAQLDYIIPADFASVFPYSLWRAEGDTIYQTDYNFDATPNAITGNTAYIDLENGNDGTANGTQLLPYKSITAAHAANFNIFYLKGKGKLAQSQLSVGKNVKLLAWPGFVPELTTEINTPLIFSANGTFPSVYQASNTAAPTFINSVFDRATIDVNGLYTGYTRQTSLALVNSNPGSFWYDSATTTLYVHTPTNRAPDADIVCCLAGNYLIRSTTALATDRYFYAEGVKFLGGDSCMTWSNTGAAFLRIGVYNCEMSHAHGTNAAVYNDGRIRAFYRENKSFYNRSDCFDYTDNDIFAFEWYNRGGRNTWASTSENGSTSHEGSRVIRVGGDYQFTMGKPIQDIDNSITYSLGCVAGNSSAGNPNNYAYAASSTAGLTKMWLIECRQTGPTNRGLITFNTGSVVNLFDGTIGNIQTATNSLDPGSTVNILAANSVYT